MSKVGISEDRLKELGEAERLLRWAEGTILDYTRGRPKDEVFEEILGLFLREADAHNDPLPRTTDEILAGADGSWKDAA